MMYQQNEENLKFFQQMFPGATLEDLQAFRQCMSTDAVYKSGLPYGITAGVLSHFMIPKRLGPIKSVLTVVLSFSSYISGKMLYSPLCKEKVFGSGNVFANKPQERRDLHNNSNYGGSIDQQDQLNRLAISSDKLLEDDSSWNNFDPFLDSSLSHFDDTGSNFQDELTTEQTMDVKQRVTYDDLWAQHRDSQTNKKYRDFRGSRDTSTERSAVPPQRVSEKTAPLETTFDEKNIWS